MGLLQTLKKKQESNLSETDKESLIKQLKSLCESEDPTLLAKKKAFLSIIIEYYKENNKIDYENRTVPGIKVKSESEVRIEFLPDEILPLLKRFMEVVVDQ